MGLLQLRELLGRDVQVFYDAVAKNLKISKFGLVRMRSSCHIASPQHALSHALSRHPSRPTCVAARCSSAPVVSKILSRLRLRAFPRCKCSQGCMVSGWGGVQVLSREMVPIFARKIGAIS